MQITRRYRIGQQRLCNPAGESLRIIIKHRPSIRVKVYNLQVINLPVKPLRRLDIVESTNRREDNLKVNKKFLFNRL